MVMPRWRSSGALSISAKLFTCPAPPRFASTLEIAAVSVVFPWSMCPMVPTLRCGFVRSNFCLAIPFLPLLGGPRALLGDLARNRRRHFVVPVELHGEICAALRHRPQVGGITEHLAQWDAGLDDLRVADRRHVLDAAATGAEVAHHVAHVVLGRRHLDGHHRLEEL